MTYLTRIDPSRRRSKSPWLEAAYAVSGRPELVVECYRHVSTSGVTVTWAALDEAGRTVATAPYAGTLLARLEASR